MLYFAIAILGYVMAGLKKDTNNMIRDRNSSVVIIMWTLITAEVGGFLILFYGVLSAIFDN